MQLRLPDEIRVELGSDSKLPGCTALLRPMDVEDKARLSDDAIGGVGNLAVMTRAVKRALITIDGLEVVEPAPKGEKERKPVRFNPRNETHWRGFPFEAVEVLFGRLTERTELTEEQEKNSDSPSGSGGTSAGAS